MRLPTLFLLLSFTASIIPSVRGEETPPPLGEKIVRLPELSIKEKMKLRPEEKWSIGQIENFEILSCASEKETQDFATKLYKFHQAFTFLFPKANSLSREKVTLVLCNTVGKFKELSPEIAESNTQTIASETLSDDFSTMLVINLDVKSAFEAAAETDSEDTVKLEGQQTGTEFIDGETLVRREYIRLLLSHSRPRPPTWLEEGVSRYFSSIKINPKNITYAQLDKELIGAFTQKPMLSMPDFFAVTPDSLDYKKSVGGSFSNQALAFVHFGMFGYKMKYQKAFLEFVDRSAKEPITEEMFKSIFKMGFNDMLAELRDYVMGGFYRKAVAPKNADFPPVPPLVLRAATDAEMGRIKGDVLRLVKRYDDARIELVSTIMRKNADARLLASLGRLDYETKSYVAAAKFLEEAVAAKVDQPAAYLALARLRLEEGKRNSPDNRLSEAQLVRVLQPLFAALSLKVTHPNLYIQIADAWLESKAQPDFDNLAVLDQGVLAYPRNTELIYKSATLKIRYGYTEDARSLVELGLKVARDANSRNRFEQLKASLPAPASKP